ncbi:hypothetical protein [Ereboglobus sp. PH5-5]|uniref:hypothetical protein n=1 Tax=Ereboglobus sp. PH5-5 TaxID=2940529 RepID=UPI0024073258|nr:hypothetical protein [Ereboglobus sp. PH5-5]
MGIKNKVSEHRIARIAEIGVKRKSRPFVATSIISRKINVFERLGAGCNPNGGAVIHAYLSTPESCNGVTIQQQRAILHYEGIGSRARAASANGTSILKGKHIRIILHSYNEASARRTNCAKPRIIPGLVSSGARHHPKVAATYCHSSRSKRMSILNITGHSYDQTTGKGV